MKRVQTNSLHGFGGGLTQGINGKSGMRSALSCLRVSIQPGMVTEIQNEFKRTCFVDLEAG